MTYFIALEGGRRVRAFLARTRRVVLLAVTSSASPMDHSDPGATAAVRRVRS